MVNLEPCLNRHAAKVQCGNAVFHPEICRARDPRACVGSYDVRGVFCGDSDFADI